MNRVKEKDTSSHISILLITDRQMWYLCVINLSLQNYYFAWYSANMFAMKTMVITLAKHNTHIYWLKLLLNRFVFILLLIIIIVTTSKLVNKFGWPSIDNNFERALIMMVKICQKASINNNQRMVASSKIIITRSIQTHMIISLPSTVHLQPEYTSRA